MPQIDGLELVGAHPEAEGVEFIRIMQPTLRGVLIREVRNGVVLTERIRNLTINGCHIYNCHGIGIFFKQVNMHQAVITSSHISFCKGGGIKIVGGEIRNLQITGNDIEYNYDPKAAESADIWFDVREGTVSEGTIASNTIQANPSPGGANIRFVGSKRPDETSPMGLWTISGNLIGNQTTNIHLKNCRAISITGNQIYSGQQRTFLIEDSRHVVIGSNSLDQSHNRQGGFTNGITVRDCDGVVINGLILDRAGGGDAQRGGAIEVFDSREIMITACQVFEPKVRGIYVTNSRNTTVTRCQPAAAVVVLCPASFSFFVLRSSFLVRGLAVSPASHTANVPTSRISGRQPIERIASSRPKGEILARSTWRETQVARYWKATSSAKVPAEMWCACHSI